MPKHLERCPVRRPCAQGRTCVEKKGRGRIRWVFVRLFRSTTVLLLGETYIIVYRVFVYNTTQEYYIWVRTYSTHKKTFVRFQKLFNTHGKCARVCGEPFVKTHAHDPIRNVKKFDFAADTDRDWAQNPRVPLRSGRRKKLNKTETTSSSVPRPRCLTAITSSMFPRTV